MDVASRGIGAIIGATIGSVIPGPGTLIGGAIGGMIGAWFGKEAKEQPLNDAVAIYNSKVESYKNETQKRSAQVIQQVTQEANKARQSYLQRVGTAPRLSTSLAPQSRSAVVALQADSAAAIKRADETIAAARTLGASGSRAPRKHQLVPVPADWPRIIDRAATNLRLAQRSLPSAQLAQSEPLVALNQLAAFSSMAPLEGENEAAYWKRWDRTTSELGQEVPRYRRQLSDWNRRATKAYSESARYLIPLINQQLQIFVAQQKPLTQAVESAATKVTVERRKLGK
jgi:hypothetical protein